MTDLDADVIVNKCPMKSTKSVGGSCGDTFAWAQCKVLDLDDKTPQQPQSNCTFNWVWEAKVPPLHGLSTQHCMMKKSQLMAEGVCLALCRIAGTSWSEASPGGLGSAVRRTLAETI